MDNLSLYIESLIFSASKAMTAKSIKTTLNAHLDKSIKEKEVTAALEVLTSKYDDDKYPFEIIEISGGFQFMTKGTYYPLISQFLKIESKKKLSRAALETLAIISYKQPITKSVMESIRGVSCDYAVQKLLEKELIEIVGRAEGPGRPLLYATSAKFMDHFGLKDLKDLPKIKEFELPGTEIGIKDTDEQPEPQFNEDSEAVPSENPESATPSEERKDADTSLLDASENAIVEGPTESSAKEEPSATSSKNPMEETSAEEPESTTPSEERKDSDLSLLDASENAIVEGPTESSAKEEPSATTPENPMKESSAEKSEKELTNEEHKVAQAEELAEPPLISEEEPVSPDMQQSVNALDEEE